MKLCLKYLTLHMFEEALYLAFEMNSQQCINCIRNFAKKQRRIIMQSAIDFHKEKTSPGSSATTLIKSLVQIANFSKKQLKKEDFSNLYNVLLLLALLRRFIIICDILSYQILSVNAFFEMKIMSYCSCFRLFVL